MVIKKWWQRRPRIRNNVHFDVCLSQSSATTWPYLHTNTILCTEGAKELHLADKHPAGEKLTFKIYLSIEAAKENWEYFGHHLQYAILYWAQVRMDQHKQCGSSVARWCGIDCSNVMKLRGPPEPASHEIFTGRLLPDLTLEEMGISIISIF